jgi:hypothetical protein
VPWDAPWMQALLNIDKTIKTPGDRPASGRLKWIGQQEELDVVRMREERKDVVRVGDTTDLFAMMSL